jgi:hypothetical protein
MGTNYAIEAISSLPFSTLIGAPLLAAIEAQGQGAKATVDFIMAVGFEPPTAGDDVAIETQPQPGKVRNVTFSYQRTDGTVVQDASLTVPLLTIVPIPYLAIEEMTIDFMAKITEAINKSTTATDEKVAAVSTSAQGGWGPCSASLKGSFSSKHSSTSATSSKYQTELTMSIHVRAKQDDMPAGLSRVLTILSDLIKENRQPAPTTNPTSLPITPLHPATPAIPVRPSPR